MTNKVYLALTQAEHNQLKHAMARLIRENHDMAAGEKAEALYIGKTLGDKENAKQWYKFSRKSTDRANRLGKLQAKIKKSVDHNYLNDLPDLVFE